MKPAGRVGRRAFAPICEQITRTSPVRGWLLDADDDASLPLIEADSSRNSGDSTRAPLATSSTPRVGRSVARADQESANRDQTGRSAGRRLVSVEDSGLERERAGSHGRDQDDALQHLREVVMTGYLANGLAMGSSLPNGASHGRPSATRRPAEGQLQIGARRREQLVDVTVRVAPVDEALAVGPGVQLPTGERRAFEVDHAKQPTAAKTASEPATTGCVRYPSVRLRPCTVGVARVTSGIA